MTTRPSIGINVEGPKVEKEAIAQMAQSVIDILEVGYETHADQATIHRALSLLSECVPDAGHTEISGCSITGPLS